VTTRAWPLGPIPVIRLGPVLIILAVFAAGFLWELRRASTTAQTDPASLLSDLPADHNSLAGPPQEAPVKSDSSNTPFESLLVSTCWIAELRMAVPGADLQLQHRRRTFPSEGKNKT